MYSSSGKCKRSISYKAAAFLYEEIELMCINVIIHGRSLHCQWIVTVRGEAGTFMETW